MNIELKGTKLKFLVNGLATETRLKPEMTIAEAKEMIEKIEKCLRYSELETGKSETRTERTRIKERVIEEYQKAKDRGELHIIRKVARMLGIRDGAVRYILRKAGQWKAKS